MVPAETHTRVNVRLVLGCRSARLDRPRRVPDDVRRSVPRRTRCAPSSLSCTWIHPHVEDPRQPHAAKEASHCDVRVRARRQLQVCLFQDTRESSVSRSKRTFDRENGDSNESLCAPRSCTSYDTEIPVLFPCDRACVVEDGVSAWDPSASTMEKSTSKWRRCALPERIRWGWRRLRSAWKDEGPCMEA